MGKIVAYLRASTDKQDVGNQKLEILEYARQKKIHVDDFIAVTLSSRQTPHKRRIDELLSGLQSGDTLVVTELSRLGRSTGQVISLVDELVKQHIQVVVIGKSRFFPGCITVAHRGGLNEFRIIPLI